MWVWNNWKIPLPSQKLKKDAFVKLVNAVIAKTINDENTVEVTFECNNCDNLLKYEVNSKFHFLKHTKIF